MTKKNLAICIVLLILGTGFPTITLATTQIDTSFGDEGFFLQDFEIGDDEAFAIAVQNDGKILVAGYSSNGAVKDLIVSRFSEDGVLDSDFNTNGVFTYSLGSGDTIGRSLAIQEDGKIIIGGSTYDEGPKVALLRVTSNGFLDTSFASDGTLTLPVDDGDIVSTGVQLTTTGSIVVAATITPESSASYAFFAKINTEGQLDTSFGEDGQVIYADGTNDVRINSISILSDEKILGGGSFAENSVIQAGLLRLNSDGTIDTAYAIEGKSTLTLGGTSSEINSIAPDSDGSIVVAGAINNGAYNEAFVGMVNEDGTTATDFASSGIYKTTYSQENVVHGVSLQDDDSISAVGFMTSPTSKDIFILNLSENTATQSTVVTYIVTDVAQNDDIAYAAVALENNLLLAAGSSSNGDNLDVALLRFTEGQTLSSSTTTDSEVGITTSGYRITTVPVTAITRVGVVSGGTIEDKTSGTCTETCTSQCGGSDNTCYSSCISTCQDGITITQKGVVFGTEPNPVYTVDDTEEEDTDDSDTTTTDTDDTESASSNDSSGSIFADSDSTGSIFPESINYYIVRLGSTNEGDGVGKYTSRVNNITPGTNYYLRAYAVLSNGEVIYGNQYTFKTNDACFIATAAYGSILEKHVVLLRQFRDNYLMTNAIGQRFVAMYYHFSPPLADTIRNFAALQTIVRIALFPAVLLALFFVKTTLVTKVICLTLGLICTLLLGFKYLTSHQVTPT